MKSFFEYLEKNGLIDPPEIIEKIIKLPLNKVVEILENCYYLINLNKPDLNSGNVFDFSANTSLSGGTYPCLCLDCRMKRVQDLSVFSSLYADKVLIPNFFDYFYDQNFNFKNQEQEFNFRYIIIGDIIAYLYFKPLIEAGIIQVNPTVTFACKHCLSEIYQEEKKLNDKFTFIKKCLENKLIKKVKFILDTPFSIQMQSDDNYLNYEVIRFNILPKELKKFVKKIPYRFSAQEIKKLDFIELMLGPTFNDLMLQKYSINANKLSYLTNKGIDSEIIEAINNEDNKHHNSIVGALVHPLPFLDGVNINKVLKIRNEEKDVFDSYRFAIKNVIREVEGINDNRIIKEVVGDIIIPEIVKIENTINNNKNYFLKKAKSKIIFTSIAISVGIFGKDIGINSQMMNALGAFAAKDIYNDIALASNIPIETRNNNYYFLWKIKNKINP